MTIDDKKTTAANLSTGYLIQCLRTSIINQYSDFLGEETKADAKETEQVITEELLKRTNK